MEVICSYETSVEFQRTTLHYIPEDSTLHNHRPTKTGHIVTNAVWNFAGTAGFRWRGTGRMRLVSTGRRGLHLRNFGCSCWLHLIAALQDDENINLIMPNRMWNGVDCTWQGEVSVNTTNVILQSISTETEFYFLPLHVSVLMGPSSGSIMIVRDLTLPYMCDTQQDALY
jgi:hypothetical protein